MESKEEKAKAYTRRDIVVAFLQRMYELKVKDLSLIPALDKFIQDGDTEFFTDFVNFMQIKSIEERTKMLEDEKAKWQAAKPEIERWVNDFESVKAEWQKFSDEHEGKATFPYGKRGTYCIPLNADHIHNPFTDYLDFF